jgi:hypothetical protein
MRYEGLRSRRTSLRTLAPSSRLDKEALQNSRGDRIHFADLEDGTVIVRVKHRSIGPESHWQRLTIRFGDGGGVQYHHP